MTVHDGLAELIDQLRDGGFALGFSRPGSCRICNCTSTSTAFSIATRSSARSDGLAPFLTSSSYFAIALSVASAAVGGSSGMGRCRYAVTGIEASMGLSMGDSTRGWV
ncbi:hypothetical protein [Lysobacter gummosus]|uniref:hypothetical protein n=1 Tax=Lysobacter gummosus TaxID=262324 RepID=UPI00363F5DB6